MSAICIRSSGLLVAALVLAACGDGRPAAIVVEVDPFLFNGPAAVALPAHLVSASGERLTAPLITARSDDSSVVRTADGALQCLRSGDATLALAAGPLRAIVRVECRPVTSFAPPGPALELLVGGPPQEVPLLANGPDGAPVTALRYSARSRDTAIAVVRDGLVVPKAMGKTRIVVELGGIGTEVSAEVMESVAADTVRFAAEEYRSWPLTAGRYRISAHAPDGSDRVTGVELFSAGANCARDSRMRETLHCVLDGDGSAVVRATRATAALIRIVRRQR